MDRSTCNIALSAPLEGNYVQINIGKQTSKCLVDTGASISCLSEHIYRRSFKNVEIMPSSYRRSFKNVEIMPSSLAHIVGVCGEALRV